MSADDVKVASQFLAALEAAARTGDREPVFSFLASDVEWVTPERTLHGVDDLRKNHTWGYPPEKFDLEFEDNAWSDLGDGRFGIDTRELYRWKETGDSAYRQGLRIEVTIRSGKISRYEMHRVG
jgi:hypothetical protein